MQGAVLQKAMWADWTRTFAMWLLAALVAASIGVLGAKPADAATFTVDRTSDAGDRNINDSVCDTSSASGRQCTLRAAIQEANDTTGADTINFNIVSTDPVKTISPASPLPPIKKAVTIDGYTQPGASPNTQATGDDAVLLIELDGTNAGDLANGLKVTGANSKVRGLAINRFEASGILVSGSGAAGNRVEGNFIGTKTDGTGDLGNSEYGVQIPGAPNNTVGGTTGGARNIISNNNLEGVLISGSAVGNNATGNKVQGNRITGNRRGVEIFGLPNNANNLIGGTASGAGNFISGNEGNGVRISESGTGNSILSNQIFGNGRLGIDLGGGSQDSFGVTPNDEDDPDTGPNSLQNFPLITSATRFSTGGAIITGTLNSTPSQNFLIQCFLADNDPSNYGEGSVLVGQAATATNANGDSPPFSCSSTIPQPGQRVTMTATRLNTSTTPATHIDTSEFAPNFVVIPGP